MVVNVLGWGFDGVLVGPYWSTYVSPMTSSFEVGFHVSPEPWDFQPREALITVDADLATLRDLCRLDHEIDDGIGVHLRPIDEDTDANLLTRGNGYLVRRET